MAATGQALSFQAGDFDDSPKGDAHPSLEQLLSSGTGGLYSGGVFIVGRGSSLEICKTFGELELPDQERESRGKVQGDEVYDLGSLTAPVVLGPIVLELLNADWLKLTDRVSRYLSGLSVYGKSAISLGHLLSHRSELPISVPFADAVCQEVSRRPGFLNSPATKECFLKQVKDLEVTSPPGRTESYSPLNPILAGLALESATGHSLESLARKMLLRKVGMPATAFLNARVLRQFIGGIDTSMFMHRRYCSIRNRVVCGEVRDLYSWGLGGVSGLAGLFSTATDLHTFAGWFTSILAGAVDLDQIGLSDAWSDIVEQSDSGSEWTLGWRRANSFLRGDEFSPEAVGYCSETGCAIICDPETGVHAVFLSAALGGGERSNELQQHIGDVIAKGVTMLS